MDIDALELQGLVDALDGAARDAARKAYPAVEKHAKALRDQWRENARDTAGRHGRLYPKAITAEQMPVTDEIAWEVGPESQLPQGGMGRGFEYGSRNQPPHWDGTLAAIAEEPKFLKALDEIAKGLL